MTGVETSQITTTFIIKDLDITEQELKDKISVSLKGQLDDAEIEEEVNLILFDLFNITSKLPADMVLEKRGDTFQIRAVDVIL